MFARHPLFARFVFFVIGPALVLLCVGWWTLRNTLPQQEGELVAHGLERKVHVTRDPSGVPTIHAATDRDAFFAMGYVHAQDRMWQLELQRRIAHGRLSEVFGKSSVEQDIWFRTLGLNRSARSAWSTLSPEARQSLLAYTAGVNSWLESDPQLPVEFTLLGIKPEPWTVYDSLAWIKVFALNLGGNYRREIERLLAGGVLDSEQYQTLFPDDVSKGPSTPVVALDRVQRDKFQRLAAFQYALESTLRIGGKAVGSNAWVVSGRLTADRSALLASDPHLGLQIPSLWYMASIKGDRVDASGATLVGLPVIIFGRNQHVAWGGTNLMADAQDIYLEQVKADDPNLYSDNGVWVPFDTRDELIEVKADFPTFIRSALRPLRIRVRTSRHGPLISDMFQVFDQPAALRWTALDPDDTSYEAFYRVNYAHDWGSFQNALQYQVAPALNLVYADREGNIGSIAVGRMPIRRAGAGIVPASGWTDAYEWVGAIPFVQWPRQFNPEQGFIVTANNRAVGADYPYLITQDWAPPARADRITALLSERAGRGPLKMEDMREIQADLVSEPAKRLLKRLLQHHPANDQQRTAHGYLTRWNGEMDRSSQAATIFNVWVRMLKDELLSDELRGPWNKEREGRYLKGVIDDVDLDTLHRMLTERDERWCDDLDTPERETCNDAIDGALNDALWEVLKVTGDESMESWAWGDLHHTAYRHTPFSQTNVLRAFFERRIASGGSPDSVNVASYSFEKSGGYSQDFGAGLRQIIEMRPNGVLHWYMNSTGQSGNVLSEHYDDMVERFRNVEYLALSPANGQVGRRLTLVPSPAGQRGAP
jgi:penicillin amidase